MERLNGNLASVSILPAPVTEAGTILCGRTFDADVLRKFYLNHDIWDMTQCDGAANAKDVDFSLFVENECDDSLIFIAATYNDEMAALFMFHQTNPCCYDIHSALLPRFWGLKLAHMMGRKACRWIMDNTTCEKITTSVPSFNESAYKMAVDGGMSLEGCNRLSFMKHGQLYDQDLLGITKGELLCL